MEAYRINRTAKSRWSSVRCVTVFIGMGLRLRSMNTAAMQPETRSAVTDANSLSSLPDLRREAQSGVTNLEVADSLLLEHSYSLPRQSMWRIVKHVIFATLRLQSAIGRGPRWSLSRSLPDFALISIVATDESSGKVCKVVHRQTGQTYALKEFPGDSCQSQQISREVQILKLLNHPNLVKCYDVYADADASMCFLLLEPLDRGSPIVTSESDLANLARQLLLGLTYLHRNKISHGDIKPSNIFFDHTGQVKLLYSGKTLSKTPESLPAEIGAVHDGFSWDIWSVGYCILKLCKGLSWFDSYDGFSGRFRSSMDEVIGPSSSQNEGAPVWQPSVELLRFLSSCMQTDVSNRWTAEQLVNHPFFNQLPPMKKEEFQIPPFKKEIRLPLKRVDITQLQLKTGEFQMDLPLKREDTTQLQLKTGEFQRDLPLKREDITQLQLKTGGFQMDLPLKKEKEIFHKREELMIPVKKKPKISMEDEDRVYDLECSKDPTTKIPCVVPEKCIDHCKLFLPDYDFGKDKLVRMWISEECIELGVTKTMEDVGNMYFDALLKEEVIIASKFDNRYRQMKYNCNTSRISDVLLKGSNYLRLNASNLEEIYGEALHLTWQCRRLDRTFFDALKSFKQLHTLVVHEDCSDSISQLPNDIFLGLKLLRTLDMSGTHIEEVPGSIGKLESLRYLDISETPIKRLPESLDRLYCLQTLNLKACFGLIALPRGLGRLVNLRHLDLDILSQLKSIPRGMGKLIELQTLQAFLVGKNDGCGIGELKNMNEIRGSFCISRLENVSNAEEAKEAALSDKKYVDKLELRWHNRGNDNCHDTTEILESLQPHFHLQELQLTSYGGSRLPSWISNPSYVDLSSITLYKCINCDILPSIGALPGLKILRIVDMRSVRNINAMFCRNHEMKVLNAFPKLEKLTLENMLTLEEWSGVEDGDFPCLRYVSIRHCPKIHVLPSLSHLYSLEHLEVSHCTQLISLPEGSLPRSLETLIIRCCPGINESCLKDGDDWSKIASVGNVWIDLEKISLD